mmetsp:Transcript_23222/g.37691  ORF Transcript_23222/g.37691 Transcript_23222/m.37691 type:complete len:256 (+) Transcript_23222:278-1045(+)
MWVRNNRRRAFRQGRCEEVIKFGKLVRRENALIFSYLVLLQKKLRFDLLVYDELYRSLDATPVTGGNTLVESPNALLPENRSDGIAISRVHLLTRRAIRQQLQPSLDHPNRIRERIPGDAGRQSRHERVLNAALLQSHRSEEAFRLLVGVEVHRSRRYDAHEGGPQSLEETQYAIPFEDLPGDGGWISCRRGEFAHGGRGGLELRFDYLEGVRDAGCDGAGGSAGEEVEELHSGGGHGARCDEGRSASAGCFSSS